MPDYEEAISALKKQKEQIDWQIKGIELDRKYASIVFKDADYWKVGTEADDEGRSHRNVGLFYGPLLDIAKHIAGHEGYQFDFQRVPAPPACKHCGFIEIDDYRKFQPSRAETFLNIRTPEIELFNQQEQVRALLSIPDRGPVKIQEGNYFGSVKITFLSI